MGGGGDAWLESLDEFKLLKKYEDALTKVQPVKKG